MLKKKGFFIITVVLLALIFFLQPFRSFVRNAAADFFYPFFSITVKLDNIVAKKSLSRKSKNELIAELHHQKEENNILAAKAQHFQALVQENHALRKQLGLKVNPYYNYIFSEIIYRDPVEWFNHFTINKGTDDGIEPGAIVLARAGSKNEFHKDYFAVAGRVGTVSKHTAIINTVVCNECDLSVFIPENGATGVIVGGKLSGSQLWSKISYLPRDLKYKPSSLVLTSGMNGLLTPPNLEVGRIMGKKRAAVTLHNNLYARAKMKPTVDLTHLRFVLILVKNQ